MYFCHFENVKNVFFVCENGKLILEIKTHCGVVAADC